MVNLASRAGAHFDPGDLVRMLDVPAIPPGSYGIFDHLPQEAHDDPNGFAVKLIDEIGSSAQLQHGALYWRWLRHLVEDSDRAKVTVKALSTEYLAGADFDHEDSYELRHARHFALLYGAGGYAIEPGLLPWSLKKFRAAIAKCHSASRARLIEANSDLSDGLVRLETALRDPIRIANWPPHGRPKLSEAVDGWRRHDGGKEVFTVIGTAFRNWLASSHQLKAVLLDLKKRGFVRTTETTDIRVDDGNRKKVRCYVLTAPAGTSFRP